MIQYPETDPRRYTRQIQSHLEDLINELRRDVKFVDDPKAEALFETSAEVLRGLKTAYAHYEEQAEEAWR